MSIPLLPRAACITRLLGLAALVLASTAQAWDSGTTPQGIRFATGGVTDDERVELRSRTGEFSLWVVTAASRSGAYLADARVVITDALQRPVFDSRLDGPWLLIDPLPGVYTIAVTAEGRTQRRVATLRAGGHHQEIFRFDVADEAAQGDRRAPAASGPAR